MVVLAEHSSTSNADELEGLVRPLLRLLVEAFASRHLRTPTSFVLPPPEVLMKILRLASTFQTAGDALALLNYALEYSTPAHEVVESRTAVAALHWLRQADQGTLDSLEPSLVEDTLIISARFLSGYILRLPAAPGPGRLQALLRLGLLRALRSTLRIGFQKLRSSWSAGDIVADIERILDAAVDLLRKIAGRLPRNEQMDISLIPNCAKLLEMHRGVNFVSDELASHVPPHMAQTMLDILAAADQPKEILVEVLDVLGTLLSRPELELSREQGHLMVSLIPGMVQSIQAVVDEEERRPTLPNHTIGLVGLRKVMEIHPACFEAAVQAGVMALLPSLMARLVGNVTTSQLLRALRHAGDSGPLQATVVLSRLLGDMRTHLTMTASTDASPEAQAAFASFKSTQLATAGFAALQQLLPHVFDELKDDLPTAICETSTLLRHCTHPFSAAQRDLLLSMLGDLVAAHNKLPIAEQCTAEIMLVFASILALLWRDISGPPPAAFTSAQKDQTLPTLCAILDALTAATAVQRDSPLAHRVCQFIVYIAKALGSLQALRRHASSGTQRQYVQEVLERSMTAREAETVNMEQRVTPVDAPDSAAAAAEAAMHALLAEEERAKAQQEAKKAKRQRKKAKAKQKQAAEDSHRLVVSLASSCGSQGLWTDPASRDQEEVQLAELQDTLCCPITQVLFRDPVVAADGHTYKRAAITDWLRCRNTSPMLNTELPHQNLVPNRQARVLIGMLSPCMTAALT
ncbi:hypothetical protein WJX72_009643 [[Myrmecia] bisecta]|uniref:U-box domain-containing protein n=1 Tax=[Myrmecia] bisecta TaxID=41462 RepID=A0AAW1P603_9CHLO